MTERNNIQQILTAENPPKVTYVDHFGSDLTVVNAARVSFGGSSESLNLRDEKLIGYLADHEHMSPFEHTGATFHVECPIYIAAQIMRHRTFSYNQISRRYTSENPEFYLPVPREQAKSNRQASGDKHARAAYWAEKFSLLHKKCLESYQEAIKDGVSREVARGILPQNLNTKFYMTGNLRNWAHFIKLRRSSDAQYEVRLIADQIHAILELHFPVSIKALLDEKVVESSQDSSP